MIKFLVKRPIAVSMVYVALIILGLVSAMRLPVSLMPNIDIPVITLKLDVSNMDARQLEDAIIKPLRRQLLQVSGVSHLQSVCQNQFATIELKLNYGTNVDLAFINVNEKVDQVMGHLSSKIKRPRVIKASASDIPVFYLNITLDSTSNEDNFIQLSRFTSEVIRRRLEQLPGVAMADISGMVWAQVTIIPNNDLLNALGLSYNDIESTIIGNNLTIGAITVKDGIYEYSLRFESSIKNTEDIGELWIRAGNKNIQLRNIAEIKTEVVRQSGMVLSNAKRAITLGIVKKAGTRMAEMQGDLNALINNFRKDYPNIKFNIVRDQTRLLNYSISNLTSTLWIGAVLAFIVMLFFLRTWQAPLLIGISIPVSLIVSILFFYGVGLTINIISLSGLVLGIGLMIDNAIVVIDNISQKLSEGNSVTSACVKGTTEIIRPLLSSVLTTCAVFLPLIFLSGMAGALLYDQAVAVTVGLLSSFFVSITLIPVYFKIVYSKNSIKTDTSNISNSLYIRLYEKSMLGNFRNPWYISILIILMFLFGTYLYVIMDKQKLPTMQQNDFFAQIDWHELINLKENKSRSVKLSDIVKTYCDNITIYAGTQQFMLSAGSKQTPQEVSIYFKLKNADSIEIVKNKIKTYIKVNYQNALLTFKPAESIFNLMFGDNQAPLTANLASINGQGSLRYNDISNLLKQINSKYTESTTNSIASSPYMQLSIDEEKLLLYHVKRDVVIKKLKMLFSQYNFAEIKTKEYILPILLGHQKQTINKLIQQSYVQNNNKKNIPLRQLISLTSKKTFKYIIAGASGEYFPINFNSSEANASKIRNSINNYLTHMGRYFAEWSGSIYSNKKMIRELSFVLLVALLLLYFILAAQFESVLIPLIILLEVPIDIAGVAIFMWIFNVSVNIMSLIGIVVMIGIIINDSILKIDTINRLRSNGMPLVMAIFRGGQMRLKPILMTSLTTIFAMVPFLFMSGMGADLQKPLAVTIIGGMFFGTLVSLYFIPLLYYVIKK